MHHARSLRALVVAATTVALAVAALPADATRTGAAGKAGDKAKASAAADWQASQLTRGRIHNDQFDFDDWGLTVDTAFALAATGNQPKKLRAVAKAFRANYYKHYIVSFGHTYSGAAGKSLLAVDVLGARVRDYGGRNLRALVVGFVAPGTEGFEAGRVRDPEGTDSSNAFGQSYAVLGLARTGGVRQSVVDYLLKQQCDDGYFRESEVADETCDDSGSAADVDSTALAIQALVAAEKGGAAVPTGSLRAAVTWLLSVQHANGSFSGGVQTGDPNANSTGLAAQALALTPHDRARQDAADWVTGLQVTRLNAHKRAAKKEIGAIAYNRAGLRDVLKNGIQTIERDQFRRATAQAIFALRSIPLSRLTA